MSDPLYPDLHGKVALITGGTKGIGRATAMLLARNGCRVAVMARSADDVEQFVQELSGLGVSAVGVVGDASLPDAIAQARQTVEAELGAVELLFPYAGGFNTYTRVWEIPLEEWDEVIRVNLTATFLAMREFLPGMRERGSGAIVVMASCVARQIDNLLTSSYAAAKAGALMLMRHAALEAAPDGVRINAIAPGTVGSERVRRNLDDEAWARTAALSPLGRMGMPADCAGASVFLASDSAGWMTGVTLDVAGGRVMM